LLCLHRLAEGRYRVFDRTSRWRSGPLARLLYFHSWLTCSFWVEFDFALAEFSPVVRRSIRAKCLQKKSLRLLSVCSLLDRELAPGKKVSLKSLIDSGDNTL